MSDYINRLPEFIAAVENEYKFRYSELDNYQQLLLGKRVYDVENNRIDEDNYIAEWINA